MYAHNPCMINQSLPDHFKGKTSTRHFLNILIIDITWLRVLAMHEAKSANTQCIKNLMSSNLHHSIMNGLHSKC